jgi:hypothetical protein
MTDLKIMPVEPCTAVRRCMASPQSYASSMSTYSTPTDLQVANRALLELQAAHDKDVATHEKNLQALENNRLVWAAVQEFMTAIGMPDGYTAVDPKSRSRFPKKIRHEAGYKTDLRREAILADGFEYGYSDMLNRYNEFKAQAEAKEAQAVKEREREVEKAKAARRANVELAHMVLRYKLDPDSTWRDVLEHLREQHQRANLAIAMMNVRADWNDGPGEVSSAMHAFKIETNEDKDIANSVLGNLGDGWDGDGRCFRDCAWNYNRLVSTLPEPLAADLMLAHTNASSE